MTDIEIDLPPIICKSDDVINIKRAMASTGLSDKTLRRYFAKYRLGRQAGPNAPILMSHPGLQMVIHGDFEALEILRSGDRAHPSAARYFEVLGIPI